MSLILWAYSWLNGTMWQAATAGGIRRVRVTLGTVLGMCHANVNTRPGSERKPDGL